MTSDTAHARSVGWAPAHMVADFCKGGHGKAAHPGACRGLPKPACKAGCCPATEQVWSCSNSLQQLTRQAALRALAGACAPAQAGSRSSAARPARPRGPAPPRRWPAPAAAGAGTAAARSKVSTTLLAPVQRPGRVLEIHRSACSSNFFSRQRIFNCRIHQLD